MYTYVRALITQANEMRTRPFVLSRVNSEGAAFFLLCHGGPSWKARPGNLFKVIFEGRLRRQFCTEHISKHLARTFSCFFLLEIISGKDAKRYLRKVFHLQVNSLESSTNFRFLSTYVYVRWRENLLQQFASPYFVLSALYDFPVSHTFAHSGLAWAEQGPYYVYFLLWHRPLTHCALYLVRQPL